MKLVSYLRLCRPLYSVPMALALPLTIGYAGGGTRVGLGLDTVPATVALLLLIAGGYVLNDVADVELDRIGASHRPIPAGEVSRAAATILGLLLWGAGVVLGSFLGPREFPIVFWTVALVLLLYDGFSRRLGVGKPIAVAALATGVFPLAIAFLGGAEGRRAGTLPAFAVWMFLTAFASGLLRDIRDRRADAQILGRRNHVQRRPRTWMIVASWMVLLGALVLIAPAFLGCGRIYAAGLPLVLGMAIRTAITRHYEPKIKLLYGEFILVGILAAADGIVYGF